MQLFPSNYLQCISTQREYTLSLLLWENSWIDLTLSKEFYCVYTQWISSSLVWILINKQFLHIWFILKFFDNANLMACSVLIQPVLFPDWYDLTWWLLTVFWRRILYCLWSFCLFWSHTVFIFVFEYTLYGDIQSI